MSTISSCEGHNILYARGVYVEMSNFSVTVKSERKGSHSEIFAVVITFKPPLVVITFKLQLESGASPQLLCISELTGENVNDQAMPIHVITALKILLLDHQKSSIFLKEKKSLPKGKARDRGDTIYYQLLDTDPAEWLAEGIIRDQERLGNKIKLKTEV